LDNSPGKGEFDAKILAKIFASPYINSFKKVTFHVIDKKSLESLSPLSEINIEHGIYTNLAEFKNKKINLTLTDLPKSILEEFNYYSKPLYQYQLHRAQLAYKNNIQLIFGPDFYFHKNSEDFNRAKYVKMSLEAWTNAGIAPIDTIRAMTINAAKSLKLENNLGIIQVRARANLIGVKGNPLLDLNFLNHIEIVINKGKIL
jgi:imidazolonepropionase-like amidohydrolase